jgi:transcriptional regulator with XRE-family HTH domain
MKQTHLDIGTIGQRLEAARQAKGISVSQAGEATRILSKFITAMEADDFGSLSAPVYAKSFIRLYAAYLGLDAAPLLEDYRREFEGTSPQKLTDETRDKLVKADQVGSGEDVDSSGPPVATAVRRSLEEQITLLRGGMETLAKPYKIAIGAGLVGLFIFSLFSVRSCVEDSSEEIIPEGVIMEPLELLEDPMPALYFERATR